ncbi:MAG: hypothetical protein NWE89_04535, partial [Candidatus Bathyarchaeota archaeon]|nr:hypothetical protein [Candidatus Bathyarchaeota archaeon]
LDVLRERWGGILGAPIVDVHHQYSHEVRRIIHWANYVTRTFPGNHTWTGPLRWYGKYPHPKRPKPEPCPFCGGHFKVIGWLFGWQVDEWNDFGLKNGLDPPWEDDSKIMKTKRRAATSARPAY